MTNIDKKIIEQKVIEILNLKLGLNLKNIKNTTSLKNDLGIDSFDSLRLIFEVEDAFNIKAIPSELVKINTIDDIVNYIWKRLILIQNKI